MEKEKLDALQRIREAQETQFKRTVAPVQASSSDETKEILQLMYSYIKQNHEEIMARLDTIEEKLEKKDAAI